MLRFYYDWESPLVKMFWVELWPILLKEFGEELVLNEISSVCTLVARDSTVNSAQSLRTACTAARFLIATFNETKSFRFGYN